MQLKGLPEGVEAVEYRVPVENEFVLVGGVLARGMSQSPYPALIVRPVEGCQFKWDIRTNAYVVVGSFAQPKRLRATISVGDSLEEAVVRAALAEFPGNPVIEEL